jgi:hypothetical protein
MSTFSEDLKGWLATPWGWLIIWIPVLAVFIAIAVIGNAAGGDLWKPSIDRICSYREEQLELVRIGSLFLQVANFWSNFAYLAVGLIIFFRNGSFIGRGTGLAFVFLAFGSGYFHGSLTEFGQFLDIVGIYMALLALIFHGVIESFDLETSTDNVRNWFWFTMVCGMFAGFSKGEIPWHKSDIGAGILGGVIGALMIYWIFAALLIGGFSSKDFRSLVFPFLLAILCFGAAAFFKFGDKRDLERTYQKCEVKVRGETVKFEALETCTEKAPPGSPANPANVWTYGSESVIQGHALWHFFSAFGMLGIFEFFTSLRRRSGSVRPWRSWSSSTQ